MKINIANVSQDITKVWFTSDLHFFHDKIVDICNRPTTKNNQTEWLIQQINSVVGKNDVVIHMGDFAFTKSCHDIRYLMNRLNGKWKFVMGNHDRDEVLVKAITAMDYRIGHEIWGDYIEVTGTPVKLVLMHFPIESWNQKRYGTIMIHGHEHGMGNKVPNRIDVGIDSEVCNNLPISLDNILTMFEPTKKAYWVDYSNQEGV